MAAIFADAVNGSSPLKVEAGESVEAMEISDFGNSDAASCNAKADGNCSRVDEVVRTFFVKIYLPSSPEEAVFVIYL